MIAARATDRVGQGAGAARIAGDVIPLCLRERATARATDRLRGGRQAVAGSPGAARRGRGDRERAGGRQGRAARRAVRGGGATVAAGVIVRRVPELVRVAARAT